MMVVTISSNKMMNSAFHCSIHKMYHHLANQGTPQCNIINGHSKSTMTISSKQIRGHN